MKPCPKLSATLVAATLAVVAAPAIAETLYVYTPPERTVYAPVETTTTDDYYTYYTAPTTTITVYGTRADEDDLITNDVVAKLAFDPRISGKIGVETNNNVVTLNGRVSTPGQAQRADFDAHSVEGVSEVQNRLRTRVGGS
jgi:hypothetical protein